MFCWCERDYLSLTDDINPLAKGLRKDISLFEEACWRGCMKQHLQVCSILNRMDFSMREKQPGHGLELIETCHYIIATEYKGKNMIKMVLSSLVQGIVMLYSDMYFHISRPIWYLGFSLERIKKKFLLSIMATAWSHHHPKSVVFFVSTEFQALWQCHGILIGGVTEVWMITTQFRLWFL